MWKDMLKGIIKNVCKEVKEEVADKVGEQFKQASGNQSAPTAEVKKPEPVVSATSTETVKKTEKTPEPVVLEPADAEAALEVPADDGERGEVSTLSEQTYSYLLPQGEAFQDCGDCGAAEIYQCYEYVEVPGKEEPAAMYFSIAPEFNCEMRESVAKAAFTRYEGTPIRSKLMTVKHPVFTHVYVFESAKTYRMSYLKQLDEYEFFACELTVKKNLVNEEQKAFFVKEFKRFAGSCSIV